MVASVDLEAGAGGGAAAEAGVGMVEGVGGVVAGAGAVVGDEAGEADAGANAGVGVDVRVGASVCCGAVVCGGVGCGLDILSIRPYPFGQVPVGPAQLQRTHFSPVRRGRRVAACFQNPLAVYFCTPFSRITS